MMSVYQDLHLVEQLCEALLSSSPFHELKAFRVL